MNVAGFPVERSNINAMVDRVWADVGAAMPRVYISINANSSTLRRRDARYLAAARDPRTVTVADGVSVTLGARLLGHGTVGRVPGVDVMEAACERAGSDGTSFYLLGSTEGVVERLAARLKARYPGLNIAGYATPPFGNWSAEDSARIITDIRESGADLLWLGVAAGKQEVWALEHLGRVGVPILCVGAALDFISGHKPRAPRWMRRAGLEWFFRLMSEPTRLWRRYTFGNLLFMADLVRFGRSPAE